jgi:hypothetical protein
MQAEKEHNFEFFNKIQKHIKKVERQSYKKVTALGVAFGVSFALVWLVLSGIGHAISNHNVQSAQNDVIQKQSYITQVKAIDDTHFKAYLNYLVENSKYYDSRIALISQSYSIAEQQDYSHSSNSNNTASSLRSDQSDFVSQMTSRSNNAQKIYGEVHSGAGNLVDNDDYETFLNDYHYFTSGIVWQDKTLERDLNNYVYASYEGNRIYNQKNGVFENYTKLTQEAQAKVKALFVQ